MSIQKLPISLVIITLNEEKNIKRCIESVPFASDIVVLDSFSKDKTKEIAQQLDARVIEQSWLGFGKQKQKAVELSRFDWILSLDADEELSTESQNEIKNKFSSLDPKIAYKLPRISFHLGRWIKHGGWYPDYQTRLFNKHHSQWSNAAIHEKVEASDFENLESPIKHYVFENISHQVITNDKYSTLQAHELAQNDKNFSYLKCLTKPFVKFFECYILKQGFLDGFPGFIIAISAGYSVFLKYVKLWEIKK